MATIKFSEFAVGSITTPGVMLVGLDGGLNKQFPAANLINGLATVTYVDAQDTILQNQITQNTNDIAAIDLSGINANVSTLQGQVTVLEGNIVVLNSAVAALENNVSINQNEIVTLQGNIVVIENELANIADTDAQTLTYDGATANLSISNGNNVILQEVLDNAGNITTIQGQIADLQANGNIQTLSLDNTSNVLSISGGNSVDFTPVLANVSGGGGNPFDQDLNTTDDVTFNAVTVNGNMDVNGSGTHSFQGTIEFTQLTNFGGSVGITALLDEDNMVSDSATALATQQSIKAYVDNAVVSGGGYSNAVVTSYAEAGWQGNIIPSANVTYDLGADTNRWKDLWLSGNTIHLGDESISVNANSEVEFSALHITGDVQIDGNVDVGGFSNKQDYVDFRDYGAVGGNVTLDTAAWDDALDDIVAAGGGILHVPRASQRYIINVANLGPDNTPLARDYSNVTITGDGQIYITHSNGCLLHIGEGTDNFLIEGLDILIDANASGGGYNKGTILAHSGGINKVTIQNMTIKNEPKPDTEGGPFLINFSDEVLDPTATGNVTNITVRNCDLEVYGRANYGIRFLRKSYFTKVLNNRITLHAWQNQNAQSFNAIAMYGWAEEFLIQGNSIFGSGHSAIACSMAINGMVKENFVKNVTNPVEGGIEVENKWDHARYNTTYTTNGVKVVNNIVQDCEYGIMVTNRNADEATSRGVYDVLIDGNSLYNNIESDIIVFDKLSGTPATANVHSDIRITNNSCFSNATNGGIRMYLGEDSAINANHVKGQSTGIHVGRDSNIVMTGFLNILGNTCEDHTVFGIHFESGNCALRCSENNISNTTNRGMMLSTCQGGTQIYNNNYVEDTGRDAYYIRALPENRKNSMFRGNRAFRATERGFYVDMYEGIISENISKDCGVTDTIVNNANTTIINNLTF